MQSMMIVLRFVHVVGAVLWVGGVGLTTLFLMPAVRATGPAGGQVMQFIVNQLKLSVYMAALGVFTILSGITLYVYDNSISSGAFAASRPGMAFGLGGVAGILAMLFGATFTRKATERLGTLSSSFNGPPSAAQTAELVLLQERVTVYARVTLGLMIVAVSCMAVARYL